MYGTIREAASWEVAVPLELVGPSGRLGQVIISDDREDGTLILLVCEEYGARSDTSIVVRPGKGETPPVRWLPWPKRRTREVLAPESLRPPFQFTLDTSGMPPGPQRFSFEQLAETVDHAIKDGTKEVSIHAGNADRWGWLGPVEGTWVKSRV
jgi:hypothetical protein